MNLNRKLSAKKHGPRMSPLSERERARRQQQRDKRKARAGAGLRRKCPPSCTCICHDTGGGFHDHPGKPCPGKIL